MCFYGLGEGLRLYSPKVSVGGAAGVRVPEEVPEGVPEEVPEVFWSLNSQNSLEGLYIPSELGIPREGREGWTDGRTA